MDWSDNPDYTEAKLILRGEKQLHPPFLQLSDWMRERYGLRAININHKPPNNTILSPHLDVMLKHREEVEKLYKGALFTARRFSKERKRIVRKFTDLLDEKMREKYRTDGLVVLFEGFAPLAIEETLRAVDSSKVRAFEAELKNPCLWQIVCLFGRPTFFFYTDEQVQESERSGLQKEYSKSFADLLKSHDEFDCVDRNTYSALFDSKENFDKNYKGSWYSYCK
jgi:hypothetical protein